VDNIISYEFITKSFKEFIESFNNFKFSNILEAEEFFIFDSIKPSINTSLLKLTFQAFYKQSKEEKNLNNLICLYFYKYRTITKITITSKNEIIEIHNPYKEFSRVISYPTDNDFTHLLTITYRHSINAIFEKSEYNKIFKIIKDNEIIREKINKGIHRLRSYIRKKIKDSLKKKIRNKELLNKEISRLLNIIFKYYKTYEMHQTGHLHTHILVKLPRFITNLDFKEIIKKLANWFDTEMQGIDLKQLKKPEDKNKAKRYVLKHMYKRFYENLFYVENEKKEKIYLLRKNALIKNDIPRMVSKSRNVKTEKYKPNFKIERKKNIEQKKKKREITRIKRELTKRDYKEFKRYLKNFKTIKEKILELEIKKIKQLKILDYFSIKDILR
jgi:hypothetical protein